MRKVEGHPVEKHQHNGHSALATFVLDYGTDCLTLRLA